MKKIEKKEYRQLLVDMLIAFSDVCEKYDLHYIIDYGTLIGVVRHHGFIPWDDDIDVTMPREDYEKLYKLAKDNPLIMGEYYRLSTFRDKEFNYNKPIFNIVDIRTITYSNIRRKKYYTPIWIDIFPMDYCDEDDEVFKKVHASIERPLKLTQQAMAKYTSRFAWAKQLFSFSQVPFITYRLKKIDKIAKSVPKSNLLTNYMMCGWEDKAPYEWYTNYIYMDFEGHKFRVPKSYDEKLRFTYGDYMQLPPEEEREYHFEEAYMID